MTVSDEATKNHSPRSRLQILILAAPIALSQAATATAGVVDTFVIGNTGTDVQLAGVGIGSVIINFLFWTFGFLRMSTTGFVSHALGRDDLAEANTALVRAIIIGAFLGLLLAVIFPFISNLPLLLFDAAPEVKAVSYSYMNGRLFGAPAALVVFAISGFLNGTGKTNQLLALQIIVNGVNALLDFIVIYQLQLGPQGVAWATSVANWSGLIFGLWIVRHHFRGLGILFNSENLKALFTANSNIMIRTVSLMLAFAFFTKRSTDFGTTFVASNDVLLQFITVSAFFLDALAWVAEKEVGESVGSGNLSSLRTTIWRVSQLSVFLALLLSIAIFAFGGMLIDSFVADHAVVASAKEYLSFCAAIPIFGVFAYLLDGIFIGAMNGALLRNASVVATLGYLVVDWILVRRYGTDGVWLAFIAFYVMRALTLSFGLRSLLNSRAPS